jgi:hypothetical protein
LREECEMLHMKPWPSCDMRRRIKWSIYNIATSRAEPENELKLWCCLQKVVAALDALPTR